MPGGEALNDYAATAAQGVLRTIGNHSNRVRLVAITQTGGVITKSPEHRTSQSLLDFEFDRVVGFYDLGVDEEVLAEDIRYVRGLLEY